MSRVCGRCGDGYEPYLVIVTNDYNAIAEFVTAKREFGGLCKPCRAAKTPSLAFDGAAEVEPKMEA